MEGEDIAPKCTCIQLFQSVWAEPESRASNLLISYPPTEPVEIPTTYVQ